MGKLITKRLAGATLVETIVAMVIILVIFGITTTVFIQANAVSFSTKKIKAGVLIDQYARETDSTKSFVDESRDVNEFTVQKTIQEDRYGDNTRVIQFSVTDRNGKTISKQKRIFRLK